ncbi:MAG: winged helix-turn-helix transcriptional regulator [Deltaproteobacteria bacterium]|nr:winged helix-turn-helix transcriptional regulator [Deltaproteobacteria bacterium]
MTSRILQIYDMQAEICKALAHPVRLRILDLISEGEKSGSQLLEILKIPKANLSQHLSVLKGAGILKERREGPSRILALAIPQIEEACELIRKVLAQRLQLQGREAERVREGLIRQRRRA